MTRVALVSGGSRGIGAAISKALQAAGYKVAANYAGNDAAAAKFKEETGIPVYKWDVSSYEQCVEGLQKVSEDLGPIEILVNNAGITRDTTLHKMTSEQWSDVINTNLNSLFQHDPAGDRGHAGAGLWSDRQYFVDQWPEGPIRSDELCRIEGG
jgi:acetoacetyl-CoA reductase